MRIVMGATMLAAGLCGAAAVQAPAAFDLVCRGTEQRAESGRFEEAPGPARTGPWRGRLRVDTHVRFWCLDACEYAFPMPGAPGSQGRPGGMFGAPLRSPPGALVISDTGEHNLEWDSRSTVLYRPATGELRMDNARFEHIPGRRTTWTIQARCTSAPFSGFPQLQRR